MIPAIKQSAIYISRPNLTVRLTISPWLTKWKRDWKASFLMLEDNHWAKFCDLAARLSSHLWQIVTSIWSHYSRWPSVGISRAQKISAVLDDYKEHNCRPLSSTSEWLTHNFNFARGGKNWRRTFSKKPGDTHAIAVTCVTITRSNTETIWKVVTLLKFAEVNQDVDFFLIFWN